jgi:hypothetical protein
VRPPQFEELRFYKENDPDAEQASGSVRKISPDEPERLSKEHCSGKEERLGGSAFLCLILAAGRTATPL